MASVSSKGFTLSALVRWNRAAIWALLKASLAACWMMARTASICWANPAEHGCQWAQSRRGDCCDNAQAESRWSRLKTEELAARDWPVFADRTDAQASVAAYFDYDNHERRHSSIGYLISHQFHQQQLVNNTQLCPV